MDLNHYHESQNLISYQLDDRVMFVDGNRIELLFRRPKLLVLPLDDPTIYIFFIVEKIIKNLSCDVSESNRPTLDFQSNA